MSHGLYESAPLAMCSKKPIIETYICVTNYVRVMNSIYIYIYVYIRDSFLRLTMSLALRYERTRVYVLRVHVHMR